MQGRHVPDGYMVLPVSGRFVHCEIHLGDLFTLLLGERIRGLLWHADHFRAVDYTNFLAGHSGFDVGAVYGGYSLGLMRESLVFFIHIS